MKKGESLNRQIITNLLKTKLIRGDEDPREEEIVRLIKLYKGADFIKKKQNFVYSPPKKEKKRVEENVENRNKDSLIEIEGW